jgi:Na+/proline symporter
MLLPNGMIGLIISAMLAASVSSIAGCVNIIAVISTNDIYKKISKNATHTQLMAVGKLSNIIAGILTIAIGILLSGFADAFRTTFTLVSHTGLAMALPIVLGLIFRCVPWWSGITAMILCFTTTLSLEFIIPVLADNLASPVWSDIESHLFEYKIGGAILVNFAVFSISKLFYKPARAAQESEKLFSLLEKPIDKVSDSEAIIVPNLKAYRVVAAALAIFGVPLGLLKLFHFVEDHKAINLYASLTFLGISLLIFWLTSRRFSPFKIVRRQS